LNAPLERLQAKLDRMKADKPDEGTELEDLRRTLAKCEGRYGYKDRCDAIRARIAELEAQNVGS
jgi:hypothetical protein